MSEGNLSFSEAIESEAPKSRNRGGTCWYALFVEQRPDDVAQLDGLLGEVTGGYRSGSSVARILSKVGEKVSVSSVNRHLRNDCDCRRGE